MLSSPAFAISLDHQACFWQVIAQPAVITPGLLGYNPFEEQQCSGLQPFDAREVICQ
jgi:hypothetical protein